jgi:pyruvate formate lyase activating enzyme
MKEALYYKKSSKDNTVKCHLCPHNCTIKEGQRGICSVRKNIEGILYSENFGQVTAMGFDPIEKKPLYHFHPGSFILSVGSFGCNFKCHFCQNWEISQATIDDIGRKQEHTPDDIVEAALARKDNTGIAFTYNEPIIYYEFMLDIAKKAKEADLKTVMVTNGFINSEPLQNLLPYMDAFSVDLKGFSEEFYKKNTKGSLHSIMDALKQIKNNGNFLEITNLVIPTLNDSNQSFSDMIKWIRDELGEDTILHISRYFPGYKSQIQPTPISKLKEFYSIAKEHINYVYLGNAKLEDTSNTYCDKCGELLVTREAFYAELVGIDKEGKCLNCGNKVFVRE